MFGHTIGGMVSTYFWYGDPRVKLMAQSVTGGVMVGFLLGLAACPDQALPPGAPCHLSGLTGASSFEGKGMDK